MPIVNRFADFHADITAWRRDIHSNPELLYDVHRTAEVVADKLRSFGVDEVTTGIGQTGVVGLIRGRKSSSGKRIGLRADMDALPIVEATGKEWASKIPGKMHACGHDGHTAMLLGAARYLAETRNFDGDVVVIFQPAEEGGAGAQAMIDDGLMEKWNIGEVYGMHNAPGLPVGEFAIRPGPLLAAADRIQIEIEGLGGHAARPHKCIDPVVVGAEIVTAIQTIVGRNVDPLESAVVSITVFQAGDTDNVIPQTARLAGTVRTLTEDVRNQIEARLHKIVESVAAMHGATAKLTYGRDYPVTHNHPEQTDFAIQVAEKVVGTGKVLADTPPVMGGEDFSFMLQNRPGAFIFCGNGDTAGLHHPQYDFNDEAIPVGCSYWVTLVETAMPA